MPEMQAWRAAAWAMCSLVLLAHCLGKNCRRMMPPVRAVSRTVLQRRTGGAFWNARDAGNRSLSTLQRIVNPEVTDKNHDESSNSAP